MLAFLLGCKSASGLSGILSAPLSAVPSLAYVLPPRQLHLAPLFLCACNLAAGELPLSLLPASQLGCTIASGPSDTLTEPSLAALPSCSDSASAAAAAYISGMMRLRSMLNRKEDSCQLDDPDNCLAHNASTITVKALSSHTHGLCAYSGMPFGRGLQIWFLKGQGL